MLILLRKVHKGDEVIRVYPMMPKYLIEVFAFTILFSLPIYKSWVGDDYRSLVPFIALFAYAGYRLLPSLQQIYSSLSALRSNSAAVDFVSGYLEPHKKTSFPIYRVDKFPNSIELVNVSSSCESDRAPALSNISLSIFKGEKVAIVGLSGSGKSSLLDIFLGLSSPSQGKLLLDGVDVGDKRLCWPQELLGYCPQSPLILDDTVAANIAFGLNENQIDQSRCYQVAEFALISEMVANLSEGLLTQLGSGGVVLSGGENQRISIARALYHNPKIIILDEPSSALDPLHAKQLFQNLCSKSSKETVVVVTHDWDLLELFDKVIVLDSGKLIGLGSYSEVASLVTNLRARGDQ
jgi:ABC-type multidrug transport system fused ATPase/permease subunit